MSTCAECYKGAIHDHVGEAEGKLEILHGKTCYVTSPPPASTSKSVLIFLTDSFGLNLINSKLLADRVAREVGVQVLIPDVIPGGGGPVSLMALNDRLSVPVAAFDILGQLKRAATAAEAVTYLPFYIRVLTSAAPSRAYPENILPFARAVKQSLAPGAKLGVVGFCWGGYGSVNLCREPAVKGGTERLIDVQFCGHPYSLSTPDMIVDAVHKFKVSFSMAIGDLDRWLHPDAVSTTEAALRQKVGISATGGEQGGYHYEIQTYEGCHHGFVIRAPPTQIRETEAAEVARLQAINWLKKYL